MTFHKVLPEQRQTLKLSAPIYVNTGPHYENRPIHSPPKTVSFFDKNSDIFHITALKHRL